MYVLSEVSYAGTHYVSNPEDIIDDTVLMLVTPVITSGDGRVASCV